MNVNKGVVWAFAAAFISGFAVFFNKFAVGFWQSSSVYITAKNLIVAVFLTSALLLFRKRHELKKLAKKQWAQLILIGLIGGSIPFLLFFKGLTLIASVNAAFIHKTLFVWVALLAVTYLKEKISFLQFVAMGILFFGVFLFLSPGEFRIGYGELLIFSATLLWAVENIVAKKVLKNISALMVGWGRMFFGSLFLLGFLVATGDVVELFSSSTVGFGWLILASIILFGYVVTWYSALKYAPAIVVSSILVLAAPITAILNSIFITGQFRAGLILPISLMVLGVLVISKIYERFVHVRQVRATA